MVPPVKQRRKFQRVALVRPLVARIGATRVYLIDASLHGVRVAHQGNIPAEWSKCTITFEWEGTSIALECRVTRSTLQKLARETTEKSVYHAGLEIVRAEKGAMTALRDMIATIVARALDEQKANARGIPAIAAQTFQTGKGTLFLRCELFEGKWRQSETTRPEQPMDGFTISAEETRDQVAMLCETFLKADIDGRRLIQLMAELSISKAEGIPTRRYVP